MGTYTQPSQILDKSHSQINEGIQGLTTTIQQRVDANRKQKKAELKEIEKQRKLNDLRGVDIAELKQKQAGAGLTVVHNLGPEEYNHYNVKDLSGNIIKVNKSSVDKLKAADSDDDRELSIDEITAAGITDEELQLQDNLNIFEIDDDDIGGIQFSIESDINFLYEELGKLDYGSAEYKMTKLRLENIIEQAPILVELLNKTTENQSDAWNMDGTIKDIYSTSNPDIEGLILDDGKENFALRAEAAQHIIFGTKQGRFEYHSWGDGSTFKDNSTYVTYDGGDKGILRLSYSEYKDLVEKGGGIVGTTDRGSYDEVVETMWSLNKNEYDNLIKTTRDSSTDTSGNRKTKISQTVKQFDEANARLEAGIASFVRKGGLESYKYSKKNSIPGYNYLQNVWQMAGGKGFYNPNENPDQEDELIKLLTDKVKRSYGDQGTKITSYNVTETEASEARLNQGQKAALSVATQDGIDFKSAGTDPDGLDETIRSVLKLEDDATSFDLKDVKNNFSKLTSPDSLGTLAVLLNSVNTRTQVDPDYLTGDRVDAMKPDDYAGDPIVLDALYENTPGGYVRIDVPNTYGKLQTLILDQINKSKSKGETKTKPNAAELKRLMDKEALGFTPVEEVNEEVINQFT